jgi:hypothetical protein
MALLSLIYFAENVLGPPRQLVISTNFHRLPKPFKAGESVLNAREALSPEPPPAYVNSLAEAASVLSRKTVALPNKKINTITNIPRSENYARTLHNYDFANRRN